MHGNHQLVFFLCFLFSQHFLFLFFSPLLNLSLFFLCFYMYKPHLGFLKHFTRHCKVLTALISVLHLFAHSFFINILNTIVKLLMCNFLNGIQIKKEIVVFPVRRLFLFYFFFWLNSYKSFDIHEIQGLNHIKKYNGLSQIYFVLDRVYCLKLLI